MNKGEKTAWGVDILADAPCLPLGGFWDYLKITLLLPAIYREGPCY